MEKKFIIGTHNGIFHSDEIVACGILKNLFKDVKEVEIIRSRDIKLLNEKCNILVDIGGGKFDHHQKGGNGKRNNNVSYASAGLVWKEFGELLIDKLSNSCLTPKESKKVFDIIDNEIIEKVDKEDNGEKIEYHPFQFIQYYLPSLSRKRYPLSRPIRHFPGNVYKPAPFHRVKFFHGIFGFFAAALYFITVEW